MDYKKEKLVSVGIPTYNRASTLRQSIDSVLNQNYTNIELIISDNASTDVTQDICREMAGRDSRVIYIRQQYNCGPIANFIEVLNRANGKFFMWLSDDDWLDSNYITSCIKVLMSQEDISLVSGRVKYYRENSLFSYGKKLDLLQKQGVFRLLLYYAQVSDNGVFYGVMRKEYLSNVVLANAIGNDFSVIATLSFLGKVRTLNGVSVHRRLGGTSDSWVKLAAVLSLSKFDKVFPLLSIALNTFKDISWRVAVFSRLGRFRRFVLALTASLIFFTSLKIRSISLSIQQLSIRIIKLIFGENLLNKIKLSLYRVRQE